MTTGNGTGAQPIVSSNGSPAPDTTQSPSPVLSLLGPGDRMGIPSAATAVVQHAPTNWGQFFHGLATAAGGVALAIVTTGEAATGVGAPLAALSAGTAATSIGYGIGNMVAAFSHDAVQQQKMADFPSTVPEYVGRAVGGETGQAAVSYTEATIGVFGTFDAGVGNLERTARYLEYLHTQNEVLDKYPKAQSNSGSKGHG